jgi:multidrug resistance efflux pump
MIRLYLLPALALLGILFGVYTVVTSARPVPSAPPAAQPALAPYEDTIAGAGIVEASTQNIALGTAVSGLVADVSVKVGDRVKKGAVLFRIDDREARAELAVRESAFASARAELARLELAPRPEDLPPAQARVDEARSGLESAENDLRLVEGLTDKRAVSTEVLDRRRFAAQSARAHLAEAEASLAKLQAGSWKLDIAVARAAADAAQARVDAQLTEIERRAVRAPVDGRVLRLDVRPGEFAAAGTTTPLVLFGDVETMHVRVDIDENDAWRFRPGAKAEAFVRGNRDLKTALEFVRVEPYVLPKRSLTGESTERVDTRVLQVLYAFDPRGFPVYVGQQMDVFVEAAPREAARNMGGSNR